MFLAALRLAFAIAVAGTLTSQSAAGMIYHRGNTAEPETLDPSKASTTYEANILRDLFEGLVMPGGLAVADDGTLYIANCGVCPDAGSIVSLTP